MNNTSTLEANGIRIRTSYPVPIKSQNLSTAGVFKRKVSKNPLIKSERDRSPAPTRGNQFTFRAEDCFPPEPAGFQQIRTFNTAPTITRAEMKEVPKTVDEATQLIVKYYSKVKEFRADGQVFASWADACTYAKGQGYATARMGNAVAKL